MSTTQNKFSGLHRCGITRRSGMKVLAGATSAAAMIAWPGAESRAQASEQQFIAALREHMRFSVGFRRKLETGYYSVRGAAPTLTDARRVFSDIRRRLEELDGDNLALVHHVDEEERMNAWLISPNGVVAYSRTPTPYRGLGYLTWSLDVDQRMGTRRAVLRNSQASEPPKPPQRENLSVEEAFELAAFELLGPEICRALSESRGRLLVLPARDTGTAPFAALPLDFGELLTRRHAVVVVPDIETLASTDMVFDSVNIDWRKALLVGNPDLSWNEEYRFSPLPHSKAEVEAVRELIGLDGRRVFTGKDATLENVVRGCSTYASADVVYLASHAISNSVNPMDGSFVGLAEANLTGQLLRGDVFEAWAAYHPLVILSACQTALGKVFDGGAYGISRVMYAAGASQLVSSLWSVDDAATQELMTEFTDKMLLGFSTETALQRAQWKVAELYGGDAGAWASFCVYGMPSVRQR